MVKLAGGKLNDQIQTTSDSHPRYIVNRQYLCCDCEGEMKQSHSQGFRGVAINCIQYDKLKRVVANIKGRNMKTAEGLPVRVTLKDIMCHAIDLLAEKYKVK